MKIVFSIAEPYDRDSFRLVHSLHTLIFHKAHLPPMPLALQNMQTLFVSSSMSKP